MRQEQELSTYLTVLVFEAVAVSRDMKEINTRSSVLTDQFKLIVYLSL